MSSYKATNDKCVEVPHKGLCCSEPLICNRTLALSAGCWCDAELDRLTFYGTTLETGMEHRTGAEPTCCRRASRGRRSAGLGPHLITYCRLVWHSCLMWPSCLLWHSCLIWRRRLIWHRRRRWRRCRDGNTGFGEKGRCEVGRDGVRLVPGQVPEAVPLCVLAKSKQKSLIL